MQNRTIFAIYPNIENARQVASDLVRNNFRQEDIGISFDSTTQETLLSLTTMDDYVDYALHIMQCSATSWGDRSIQKDTRPHSAQPGIW